MEIGPPQVWVWGGVAEGRTRPNLSNTLTHTHTHNTRSHTHALTHSHTHTHTHIHKHTHTQILSGIDRYKEKKRKKEANRDR